MLGSPYCISKGMNLGYFTKKGKWAFSRHRNNQLRGERSNVEGHKKAMSTVGMLQDLGGEPFVIQHSDPDNDEEFELCHFASRTTALQEVYLEDPEKTSKAIELSIKHGLKRCKLISRTSPDLLTVFLVALGTCSI